MTMTIQCSTCIEHISGSGIVSCRFRLSLPLSAASYASSVLIIQNTMSLAQGRMSKYCDTNNDKKKI